MKYKMAQKDVCVHDGLQELHWSVTSLSSNQSPKIYKATKMNCPAIHLMLNSRTVPPLYVVGNPKLMVIIISDVVKSSK